jgi:hypothetical protein
MWRVCILFDSRCRVAETVQARLCWDLIVDLEGSCYALVLGLFMLFLYLLFRIMMINNIEICT